MPGVIQWKLQTYWHKFVFCNKTYSVASSCYIHPLQIEQLHNFILHWLEWSLKITTHGDPWFYELQDRFVQCSVNRKTLKTFQQVWNVSGQHWHTSSHWCISSLCSSHAIIVSPRHQKFMVLISNSHGRLFMWAESSMLAVLLKNGTADYSKN